MFMCIHTEPKQLHNITTHNSSASVSILVYLFTTIFVMINIVCAILFPSSGDSIAEAAGRVGDRLLQ